MSQAIITTIRDLVETLPKDEYFVRESDELGPYFYPVEHAVQSLPADDPHWKTVIRIWWNDDFTAAVAARAIPDPNAQPDRSAMVYLHKSLVHGKQQGGQP